MVDHAAVSAPATPVIDRLKATGTWNPNWDPCADLDPEWTERFLAMGMMPIARGVLDPKTWEFIAIAVDASCTHLYGPGVRRHIAKALDLGATRDEILGVLQAVSVLGIHSMSLGTPILVEELARRADGAAAPAHPAEWKPLRIAQRSTTTTSLATGLQETTLHFADDSLLPENQDEPPSSTPARAGTRRHAVDRARLLGLIVA